ncbi:MAG: CDP-alcohol phosphatidyltransferase family protein [Magnetococcales bacterium]|nr:CDP-alcohol phosphatidyltransferase family protein [Magnetococcales bacterium]
MNPLKRMEREMPAFRKRCWDPEKQSSTYRENPANWEALFVTRRISPWITYLLHTTSITPNQVTAMWVVSGIIGALLLIPGQYALSLIGIFLLWVAWVLDNVDGELARVKGIFSSRGDLMDMLGHQIHLPLAMGSLTAGVALQNGEPFVILCGMIATALSGPIMALRNNVLLLATLCHFGRTLPPVRPHRNSESENRFRPPSLLKSMLGVVHTDVGMFYLLIVTVLFSMEAFYLIFFGMTLGPALLVKFHTRARELENLCHNPDLIHETTRPEWLPQRTDDAHHQSTDTPS